DQAAGLAVDHPDDAVGVGLGAARAQLVEQPQRALGVLARVLEALPRHVDFGLVRQADALEPGVARALGDRQRLAIVAVGGVVLLAVGAHHAEVVIGDGAAVLVAGATIGRERALVALEGLVQV